MSDPLLDERAEKVLTQVRTRTAMPLLEIAAVTGVRGADLEEAVKKLAADGLVTVEKLDNPLDAIVSVGGK
jgi:Mn-dependent DtxR family transcriptional regulator